MDSRNSLGVANALCVLQKAGLLTPENRSAVVEKLITVSSLRFANLIEKHVQNNVVLTQTVFNDLISYSNVLFGGNRDWLDMIPNFRFRDMFPRILEIARSQGSVEARQAALLHYVNQALNGGQGRNINGLFNDKQSTHRVSVHRSVSNSATRLFNRYCTKHDIKQLEEGIKGLSDWLKEQPKQPVSEDETEKSLTKAEVAKNWFDGANFNFFDQKSGISMRQLLALFWIAIHDEDQRIGVLSDAQEQLIAALFEIARGYNLDERGNDDGAKENKSICASGAFNKLIEKLVGIHPDAKIEFITQSGATYKLQALVKGMVQEHFKDLSTEAQAAFLKEIKQELRYGGGCHTSYALTSGIWNELQGKPENKRTLDDFWEEYRSGYTNTEFMALLGSATDVDLTDFYERNTSGAEAKDVETKGDRHSFRP